MVLTDRILDVALYRTTSMIEMRDSAGHPIAQLTPEQVAGLLAMGQPYEACGTKRRVQAIRAIERPALPVIENPWHPTLDEHCWRVSQAAVAWSWMESRGVPLGLDGRPA